MSLLTIISVSILATQVNLTIGASQLTIYLYKHYKCQIWSKRKPSQKLPKINHPSSIARWTRKATKNTLLGNSLEP